MEQRKLYYRDDRSDKVYVATLDGHAGAPAGYRVTFAWGRRGSTLQTKTFGPGPECDAYTSSPRALWNQKIGEKLAKGYRDETYPQQVKAAQVKVIGDLPMPAWKKPAVSAPPPPPVQPARMAIPGARKFRFQDD